MTFIPLNNNIVSNLFLFNKYGTFKIESNNDNVKQDNNIKQDIVKQDDNIKQDNDIFEKSSNNDININIDSIINDAEIDESEYLRISSDDDVVEPDSDVNTTESLIDMFT